MADVGSAIDDAFAMGGCKNVRNVIVYQRTGGKVAWTDGRDKWLHDVTANQPDTCDPMAVDSEHPRSSAISGVDRSSR